jgi:hypothetical protein
MPPAAKGAFLPRRAFAALIEDLAMSQLTRRKLAALVASGAAAAAFVASAVPAEARQGNMDHALNALREARRALQAATPNKGGHRERAIDLIDRAINQVQEGIIWADRNG